MEDYLPPLAIKSSPWTKLKPGTNRVKNPEAFILRKCIKSGGTVFIIDCENLCKIKDLNCKK